MPLATAPNGGSAYTNWVVTLLLEYIRYDRMIGILCDPEHSLIELLRLPNRDKIMVASQNDSLRDSRGLSGFPYRPVPSPSIPSPPVSCPSLIPCLKNPIKYYQILPYPVPSRPPKSPGILRMGHEFCLRWTIISFIRAESDPGETIGGIKRRIPRSKWGK